jgi:negative regulator of replication initiation
MCPPLGNSGKSLVSQRAWLGQDQQCQPAQGNRQSHKQPCEPFWVPTWTYLSRKRLLLSLKPASIHQRC